MNEAPACELSRVGGAALHELVVGRACVPWRVSTCLISSTPSRMRMLTELVVSGHWKVHEECSVWRDPAGAQPLVA